MGVVISASGVRGVWRSVWFSSRLSLLSAFMCLESGLLVISDKAISAGLQGHASTVCFCFVTLSLNAAFCQSLLCWAVPCCCIQSGELSPAWNSLGVWVRSSICPALLSLANLKTWESYFCKEQTGTNTTSTWCYGSIVLNYYMLATSLVQFSCGPLLHVPKWVDSHSDSFHDFSGFLIGWNTLIAKKIIKVFV